MTVQRLHTTHLIDADDQFGRMTTYVNSSEVTSAVLIHNGEEQRFRISQETFDAIFSRYKEPHHDMLHASQLALAEVAEAPANLTWRCTSDGAFHATSDSHNFKVSRNMQRRFFANHAVYSVVCSHRLRSDVVVSECGKVAQKVYESCLKNTSPTTRK